MNHEVFGSVGGNGPSCTQTCSSRLGESSQRATGRQQISLSWVEFDLPSLNRLDFVSSVPVVQGSRRVEERRRDRRRRLSLGDALATTLPIFSRHESWDTRRHSARGRATCDEEDDDIGYAWRPTTKRDVASVRRRQQNDLACPSFGSTAMSLTRAAALTGSVSWSLHSGRKGSGWPLSRQTVDPTRWTTNTANTTNTTTAPRRRRRRRPPRPAPCLRRPTRMRSRR